MTNRLYRNHTGAMLGGVCSGLASYLKIDPVWVRLFFVLLAVTSGIGVLAYLILWIVIPRQDQLTDKDGVTIIQPADMGDKARLMGEEIREAANKNNPNLPLYIGIGLVVVGGFAILNALPFQWIHWVKDIVLWPAILILAGVFLMIRAFRGEK